MLDFFSQYYFTIKALHLIAVICWMAGLLYLPRLFVYHANATPKTELYETFKIMEYKLLRYIMNPAMVAVFILGAILMMINGFNNLGGWFHAKLVLVLILSALHGMMAYDRKKFANEVNTKSATYFRVINEIPALLMVAIIFLAVLKPF